MKPAETGVSSRSASTAERRRLSVHGCCVLLDFARAARFSATLGANEVSSRARGCAESRSRASPWALDRACPERSWSASRRGDGGGRTAPESGASPQAWCDPNFRRKTQCPPPESSSACLGTPALPPAGSVPRREEDLTGAWAILFVRAVAPVAIDPSAHRGIQENPPHQHPDRAFRAHPALHDRVPDRRFGAQRHCPDRDRRRLDRGRLRLWG